MKTLDNLETVTEYFARIKCEVELKNKIGHYDINRYLENVVAKLLNNIYGFELINENKSHQNYPGIDLKDETNRIAVQVTSENNIRKINKTISIFTDKHMNKQYDRLLIFMIKDKSKNYKSDSIDRKGIDFEIDRDILDFNDLYRELAGKCNDKLSSVIKILKEECDNTKNVDLDKIKKLYCTCKNDFYIHRRFIKADEYGIFNKENGETLEEILKKYNKIVLLSEAGKGKTEEVRNFVNRIIDKEKYDFPFYIKLNTYTNEDIEELVPKEYKEIENEKLIFVLDGLDEINDNERSIFIKKLEKFCDNNKKVRVIITCRTNFYKLHNKDFNGMITDFNEYVFCDISYEDINLVLDSKNINIDDFWKEINNKSLNEIIYNPFYLDKIVNLYLENYRLPNRQDIMDTFINESFKLDENKYKNSMDIKKEKDKTYNLLSIIALSMEMLGRNYISEKEYCDLVEIEKNRNVIEHSSVWRKDNSGNWGFIHNNFGEYLASYILSKISLEEIKKMVCYENTDKIKQTWVNTLSFLVNTTHNKKIIDWIIEVMPEFIAYIEDGVITEEKKQQIFKMIFKKNRDKRTWIPYTVYKNKNMINREQDLEMIIKEIDRNEHYTISGNALHILGNLEHLYGKEEKIKKCLMNVCQKKEYTSHNKECAMNILSNFRLGNTNDLKEIIRCNPKEDSALRRGYFHYCNELNIVSENIDMFLRYYEIEQVGMTANWDDEYEKEPYSYEEHLEFEKAFSKINNHDTIDKVISFLKNEKIKDRDFEKNVIANFIKSIINVYKDKRYYVEKILDIYLICEEKYDYDVMKIILRELERNNAKLEFFKKYIKKSDNPFFRVYDEIIDDKCMEELYYIYIANECNDEIILYVLSYCNKNINYYQEIKELYEKRTGNIIKEKIKVDYNAVRKVSKQKFFNNIFCKEEFIKFINSFLEKVGKTDICNDDLDKIMYDWLNTDKDYYYLGNFLRFGLKKKEKINSEICSKWEWDNFIWNQSYKILSAEADIYVSDSQKTKIYEICKNYLAKVDFRKCITYKKDKSWTISSSCIYLAFFRDKFDFDYPKEVLLDMLQFEYPIKNRNIGIEYIEKRVNRIEVKNRIIDNLKNENIHTDVFENHINYCIKNRISDCIENVGHYILNKQLYDTERIKAYEYLSEFLDIEEFVNQYFYKLDEDFQKILLDRIIERDRYILEDWILKKLMYSKKLEKRMLYAKYLILLQSKYGIKYYYNWCKKENKAYVDKISYESINRTLEKVNSIELLDYLLEFIRLTIFTKGFIDIPFEGIYNNVRKAILSIGLINRENFLEVKKQLGKMACEYKMEENVGMVHCLIEDINIKYCEKNAQKNELLDVRMIVKNLYERYIVRDKWI